MCPSGPMALIRNIVALSGILRSIRDDSQHDGLEKGWGCRRANQIRRVSLGRQVPTSSSNEVLFLHPGGAVAARVGMRDAAPDGMRLSGQAATEHRRTSAALEQRHH